VDILRGENLNRRLDLVHEWREGAGFWVEVEVEVEVRMVRALARGEEGKSFIVWDESG
jgi:hypothetical protein